MSERDLAGSRIDRYAVIRRLGAGGMGTVWLVRHVESLQEYALKTLHPHVACSDMAVERFLREARAAAALRSKHVVQVIDAQMSHVDPTTGVRTPFLVMELLQGETLAHHLASRGPFPAAELVWVMRQVARALDLAHTKGIVHRDLKPENIFVALDDDGEPIVKICDFGVAKLVGDATGLASTSAPGTQTGAPLGTPMYMSPEQVRGIASVGPESDQWALGLIAFEVLTAREYFAGATTTADLILRIVNDDMEAPSLRAAWLPPAFDAWFARSCARDPSRRWGSVGEQVAALSTSLAVDQPAVPRAAPVSASVEGAATLASAPPPPRPSPPLQPSPFPPPPSLGERARSTTAAPSARTFAEATARESRSTRASGRRAWMMTAAAVIAVTGGALALIVGTSGRRGGAAVDRAATTAGAATGARVVDSSDPAVPAAPAVKDVSSIAAPVDARRDASTTPASGAPTTGPSEAPVSPRPRPSTLAVLPRGRSGAPSGLVPGSPSASSTSRGAVTSMGDATKPPAEPVVKRALLPKGAACVRSSECESAMCVAEACK